MSPTSDKPNSSMNKAICLLKKNDVNKIAMGGADIMSTAYDYGKFLQMILNDGNMYGKQIISKKTARMIYKPLEVFYGGEFVSGLGPESFTAILNSFPILVNDFAIVDHLFNFLAFLNSNALPTILILNIV